MAKKCDDIEIFKNFVEGFSLNDLPTKPSFPHRRHQTPPVRWNEVEGECIDLAMNCLKKCKCPLTLSFAIARSATNKVLQSKLDQFANVDKNSATKVYSSKVLEEIIRKSIEEVCLNWTSDFPTLKYEKPPVLSDCGIQNLRRKMEDKHNVLCNVNLLDDVSDLPTIQLYSIFDGHAGVEAAAYASKQLHLRMIRNDHFPGDIPLCLKSVLKEIDDAFCEKANSERIRSGCTALVAVVYESIFHLAWVGDSQAVIVKDGVAIELMEPHKPEREDERQRIEEAGGVVVNFGSWRVNGNLSVSRAIGDPDFKPYVCADADVTSCELVGDEDYFCLACDGFWDVYEAHDLPPLVAGYLTSGGRREDISEYLCRKASEKGSQDNITVIVVFLRDEVNLKTPLRSNDAANSITIDEAGESASGKQSKEASECVKENSKDGVTSFNRSTTNSNDDGTKLDTIITGCKVLPCEKEKIPHRLLVNYVRSNVAATNKTDKVVVTESHPHLKMPSSLYKQQKKRTTVQWKMTPTLPCR